VIVVSILHLSPLSQTKGHEPRFGLACFGNLIFNQRHSCSSVLHKVIHRILTFVHRVSLVHIISCPSPSLPIDSTYIPPCLPANRSIPKYHTNPGSHRSKPFAAKMSSQYKLQLPSSVAQDPAIVQFFEDFYATSDTPDAHEKYAAMFTDDATFVLGNTNATGSEGMLFW